MSQIDTISFGGQQLTLQAIPLGRVRQMLVVSNRLRDAMVNGQLNDATTLDMMQLIALGTGKTVEELDAMPGTMEELEAAMDAVVQRAGLVKRKAPEGLMPGETAQPAATQSAGLTTSTPT